MERENRLAFWGRHLLCGLFLGAGAVLPGVSGGVLAVVFGIYEPFMELLAHPRRALPRHWRMLLPLGIGWCAGFFLFAWGVLRAMNASVAATTWLLIGLIAGTVPTLFREAGREGRSPADWVSLFLCAAAAFALLRLAGQGLGFSASPGLGWYFFAGALCGVGTVLPGFSASPVLMGLGLYQPMLEAMSRMDPALPAAFLPGMVLAAASLARGMNWLFHRFRSLTCHGILGIVAASTLSIIPVSYTGVGEAALCALCCAAGFLLAFFLARLDRRQKEQREREAILDK